jgi:protein involved in temperature-dependent protein secretion
LNLAEDRLREALAIQQAALTADHPDLAITRVDLAEALLLAGDSQEALVQAQLGCLLKPAATAHRDNVPDEFLLQRSGTALVVFYPLLY